VSNVHEPTLRQSNGTCVVYEEASVEASSVAYDMLDVINDALQWYLT
jgi:hypothetical protein